MNIVKFKYIVLLIFFVNQTVNAQIPDFSKKQPELHPLNFEGDKFWLSSLETENVLAGIVGENVYFRDNLCEVTDFLSHTSLLNGQKIILKCENIGKKELEQDEFNEIVFLKSINNTTNFIQNRIYTYKGASAENYDLNGSHLLITNNEEFSFIKAFYCKVEDDKFSICIERDNGHIFEIDSYNGRIPNQGRITLKGMMNYGSFVLVTDKSTELEGNELGELDNSGNGIFGRKIIYRDLFNLSTAEGNGRVVFKVCINRSGNVTNVKLNELETTLSQKNEIKKVEKAMWTYKFSPDPTAPIEQCGRFSFSLRSRK